MMVALAAATAALSWPLRAKPATDHPLLKAIHWEVRHPPVALN
jgi:hypothetical protein